MEAGLKAAQGRTQMFRILWMYCALLGLTTIPTTFKWEGFSEVNSLLFDFRNRLRRR